MNGRLRIRAPHDKPMCEAIHPGIEHAAWRYGAAEGSDEPFAVVSDRIPAHPLGEPIPTRIEIIDRPGYRPVWVADDLFASMGFAHVEWGQPDPAGFYTPTVFRTGPILGDSDGRSFLWALISGVLIGIVLGIVLAALIATIW